MRNSRHQRLLRLFLAGRDIPCPVCRYNLRDLPSTACPECGNTLELRIGAAGLRFGRFVLLLAPLLGAAGLASFFVSLLVQVGWPGNLRSALWVLLILGLGLLDVVLAPILYVQRGRFLRARNRAQFFWIALVWLIHGVVITLAAKIIR